MHVAPRRPSQKPLAAFIEALAVDKSVLVIGDASDSLGSFLVELGARSVELWDADERRAISARKQAPRGLVVRPLPTDAVEVRTTGFDFAVVTDLGALDDAEQWVRWICRWVGDRGVAIFATPSGPPPEHFDYYELYDILAGQFANVRMVGQIPFSGVAFAEFGVSEDCLAVTVDGQLADSERVPEAFVAVVSQHPISIDPYLIVQLPRHTQAVDAQFPIPDPPRSDASLELRRALEEKSAEKAYLAREVDARTADVTRLSREVEAHTADVTRLSREVEARTADVTRLSREVEARAADIVTLRSDLVRAHAQIERAENQLRTENQREVRRAETAERELASVRAELSALAQSQDAEVARYEGAMRERAQAALALETELVRRERMIQELVDGLEDRANEALPMPPAATVVDVDTARDECAELRTKIEALALDIARREGEAQAAAWTITELEHRLAECAASKGVDPVSGRVADATVEPQQG